MHTITILGDGGLGSRRAADAARARRLTSRSSAGRHGEPPRRGALRRRRTSWSRRRAATPSPTNVASALDAGVRRMVIATTGWTADRPLVEGLLAGHGAGAVAASNFSLGVALFGRLVDAAVALFGRVDGVRSLPRRVASAGQARPPVRHRARPGRTDRRRPIRGWPRPDDLEVVSIRAGASPGMHLVGFDAAGETVELRLTARDRSAYATGILAAADWLDRAPRVRPASIPSTPSSTSSSRVAVAA